MAERIGIFGGTFDPIHVGHLVAAVNARHDLGLDRVVLMVANVPWQKAGARQVTAGGRPPRHGQGRGRRGAGAGGQPAGDRPGRAFLHGGHVSELTTLHPGAELFVIVGWDVSASWPRGSALDEIRDLATLVVVNRPGTPAPVGLLEQGWRLEQVTVPNLEISSTDLRARAASGRPLDYLVPEAAVRVIRERGLYSVSG